jgi:hypothetical protein
MRIKNLNFFLFSFCLFFLPTNSFALKSLDSILVGATYRMVLTTGDDLEGTVYSKNDSSLILDCKGTPYTFMSTLIVESKLIAPPAPQSNSTPEIINPRQELLTFETLQKNQPIGLLLQILLKNGKTFKGSLISLDDEFIKLSIEDSSIPIAKNIIEQIISLPMSESQPPPMENFKKPPIFSDTLIVKNSETDSSGTPLGNKTLIGKILKEDDRSVTFSMKDSTPVTFLFEKIIQIFRHSDENSETEYIRRYALPLLCPSGMMLVDVPPGKAGRPFFKICIDKYEYPNQQGHLPKTNVSFTEAKVLCEQQGKRLCSSSEWQWACSGLEGFSYSYGWNFDKALCNIDGKLPEASGTRSKCIGKFGVMDMTGNVFEWVKIDNGNPAAMGGPLSKCQAISPGESGSAKPQTGFRCCTSN